MSMMMMIMMMMDWFLSGLAVASTRVQLWRGRERHQRAAVKNKSESPLFIVRQRWPYGERR